MTKFFANSNLPQSMDKGPLGVIIPVYASLLSQQGYSQKSAQLQLRFLNDMNQWLNQQGMQITDLSDRRVPSVALWILYSRPEGDIRGYVKWRKISGGTRSDLGKRCRDGLASLKKTCRKLGVSFRDYLGDRIGQHWAIAPLPDIIRERAAAALAVP